MGLSFSEDQLRELDWVARRHPDAHVRSRALAVRAVALGHERQLVARLFPYSAYSIGQWVRGYGERGVESFAIRVGRGRRSQVDEDEVRACLRRSPEWFGLNQARWTLKALGQACPSLHGMSQRGILNVLHRLGFRYKRGQPWIHSPDPLYEVKKTRSKRPIKKRGKTRGGFS